jgi:hypothetical protein
MAAIASYNYMYEAISICSGSSGTWTANLSCTLAISASSSGRDRNEMARPLVPNLPARPTRCKYWSDLHNKRWLGNCEENTTRGNYVLIGEVIVDDDIDALDVDTAAEEVSGDEDTLVELLEALVLVDALLLIHPAVNADRREVAVIQKLVQLFSTIHLVGKVMCMLFHDRGVVNVRVKWVLHSDC